MNIREHSWGKRPKGQKEQMKGFPFVTTAPSGAGVAFWSRKALQSGMADFVDYNKRDTDLPSGCKDLIDLLNPIQEADLDPMARQYKWAMGPISDIKKYVQALFASPASSFDLWITHQRIIVTVWKTFHSLISATVEVQTRSDQEWAALNFHSLLNFLSNRALAIPADSAPGNLLYRLSPLPPDSIELAQLLSDLFRDAGVTEETTMRFCYRENSTPEIYF